MKYLDDMDSDGKFWLGIWTLGLAAFVALVIAVAVHAIYEDSTLVEREKNRAAALSAMVQAGADPIRAKCAIDYGTEIPGCLVIASKELVQ